MVKLIPLRDKMVTLIMTKCLKTVAKIVPYKMLTFNPSFPHSHQRKIQLKFRFFVKFMDILFLEPHITATIKFKQNSKPYER